MMENNRDRALVSAPKKNLGSPDRVPICISIRPGEWQNCQQLARNANGGFGLSVSDWATLVVEEISGGFHDAEVVPLLESYYFRQPLKWSSLSEATAVRVSVYVPDEECVDTFLIRCDKSYIQAIDLLANWLGVDRNMAASALVRREVAES